MTTKRDLSAFDIPLVAFVIALSVIGVVVLKSSGDTVNMQIVWIITGLGVLCAAAFIDYDFICSFYMPFYIVNLGLLGATLIIKQVTGETLLREISFGPVSIMPSEFSKIFMIIFISKYIDNLKEKINKFYLAALLVLLVIVPFVLTVLQPSLSASFALLFISVILLFAGKLHLRYFIIAAVIIIPALIFLYYDINRESPLFIKEILEDYQIDRLMPLLNPSKATEEDTYQLSRSVTAISSGQLTGVGYGNNKVAVPFANNDFIFSTIGAEFGFIGSVATILIGFGIVFRCLIIAWRSEFFVGRLLCTGVAAMFAVHIFINVGVATWILPNTGITFPFISSGGSSVWSSMACVGLVINVGMKKTKSLFED